MNGIITNTEGAINIDLLIRLIHWTINMDSLIWWYFMIFHCYLWYGGVLNWKHPQSSSILFDDFPWNSPAIKGYPQYKTESLIYMSHIVLWLKQYWLVVDLPLWKIWFPQLGLIIPNIWKNKKCSKPPIRTWFITVSNDLTVLSTWFFYLFRGGTSLERGNTKGR